MVIYFENLTFNIKYMFASVLKLLAIWEIVNCDKITPESRYVNYAEKKINIIQSAIKSISTSVVPNWWSTEPQGSAS
jgi:hypothetical protein